MAGILLAAEAELIKQIREGGGDKACRELAARKLGCDAARRANNGGVEDDVAVADRVAHQPGIRPDGVGREALHEMPALRNRKRAADHGTEVMVNRDFALTLAM